jgi:phosphatidate cytidylyltransferase
MVSAVVIVLGSYMASIAWLLFNDCTWQSYLMMLTLIIFNDVGCYLGGRLIGGRKLAPSISPGKTISGALCGLAAGIFPMLLWFFIGMVSVISMDSPQQDDLFGVLITLLYMVGLGGFWPLLAQAGDLLESYFKRLGDAKDSGHLIPGHGGVLDRFDSQLLTMPAAALFTWLLQGM